MSGLPMRMDCRGSTVNCSLSSEVTRTAGLNSMTRGEFRTSYQGLYPFHTRELAANNTEEQLIGYLGG